MPVASADAYRKIEARSSLPGPLVLFSSERRAYRERAQLVARVTLSRGEDLQPHRRTHLGRSNAGAVSADSIGNSARCRIATPSQQRERLESSTPDTHLLMVG